VGEVWRKIRGVQGGEIVGLGCFWGGGGGVRGWRRFPVRIWLGCDEFAGEPRNREGKREGWDWGNLSAKHLAGVFR